MLHDLPEVLRQASVIMHLNRGAGWPNGGWIVAALPLALRRQLVAKGYMLMEDADGRIIIEPPEGAL